MTTQPDRDAPETIFQARVRIKAEKEGITEAEARALLLDANKPDLFSDAPSNQSDPEQEKKAKSEARFEKILDNYFNHLELIFAGGVYSDFLQVDEIVKMAEIKRCITKSKHPRIKTLESLYNKVVDLIRKTWSENVVEQWYQAINDELARLQSINSLNAFTCPTAQWSDINSEGKPKPPILCAINAIRYLLERRKLVLKEDIWKQYSVIMDDKGNEQYVSKQTDSIIREWRNWIYDHKGTLYSMDILKDAYHQIAKINEFHSYQEKIKSIDWDKVDRYEAGAKAFGLKIDGEGEENNFTVRVFKQHLMASLARVFYPGVWYDLVLCTFGFQGAGKTTGLRILYGRDNVISCNFFELDPKRQSEATRHGIAAVENPDTFGDARKADFNRIKADVSTDSWVGRDAYGRMEDMRRVLIAYVIWYTGNDVNVLRDPTGNRRFIIVYSERAIDEDWLRLHGSQLWAQAYVDMMQLRASYLDELKKKGINEEYPKYLELPKDLWEEAKRRQDASMVINEQLQDWVPELILQNFVVWPAEKSKKSILVLTRDILKYLQEKGHKNIVSDQTISAALHNHVVFGKDKCDGLKEDIRWKKAQIKRKHGNLRGYRIDFNTESERRAFWLLKEIVDNEGKSCEENFDPDNIPGVD
jgi:Virulence-associated protein E